MAEVKRFRCPPRRVLVFMAALAALVASSRPRPVLALDLKKVGPLLVKQSWQTEQGLPQVSVTAIVQTRDGYIWVGTFGGLARFDGVRFTVFDSGNTPGIAGNRIRSLFEDRDGVLWIGTETGLSRFAAGRFSALTVADGLPGDTILSITQDSAGRVWVGTHLGIAGIEGHAVIRGAWQQPSLGERSYARATDDGRVLAMIGWRLFDIRGDVITELPGAPDRSNRLVTAMYLAHDGSLWVGYTLAMWRRSPAGSWSEVKALNGTALGLANDITRDRDGNIVITAGREIIWWRDGRITRVEAPPELNGDTLRLMLEGRDGRLWLGTDRSGLHAWHPGRISTLGPEHGLFNTSAVAVLEDRAGTLWVSAGCEGLFQIINGAGRRFQDAALGTSCVRSMAEDAAGNLWLGTIGAVHRLAQGRVVERYALPTVTTMANAILPDRDGALWVGTDSGAYRLAGDQLVPIDIGGSAGSGVTFVMQDRSGAVWMGARGLVRLMNGERRTYTTRDGLSNAEVRAIHEDAGHNLWVGTYGGGLNRFKDGRFTHYSTANGLLDNTVSRIIEDDRGYLWLNGNAGISRVAIRELIDLAEGRAARVEAVLYGTADGMKSREGNGGTQPAGWRSRDGRLWMPTVRGIAVLDPGAPSSPPPTAVIEEIQVNDQPGELNGPSTVGPGINQLTFTYTALAAFNNPSQSQFRFRLDGYDDDWVDAGTRRQAFYTNLGPGQYRFEVMARNSEGVWSTAAAVQAVTLVPYFYETTWFAAVAGLTVIAAGWAAYRLSVRRLRARARALTQLVQQRSEAEEALRQSNADVEAALAQLHLAQQNLVQQERLRALGQMASGIAHDINNALAPVLGYSELLLSASAAGTREAQVEQLRIINTAAKDAASVVRRLVEFHRRRPEGSTFPPVALPDLVTSVISLSRPRWESEARARGVTITIETDLQPVPPVSADESELREAIINIVFNAVEAMPDGGTIRFATRTEGDLAVLAVSDTGVGMSAEVRLRCFEPFFSTRGARGTGLGLSTVFGTIQRLDGAIAVDSAPGMGTTFTILLPARTVATEAEPATAGAAPDTSLRVFLVEDEPLVRELMVEFLRVDGHRVDAAENGVQGLSLFRPGAYDLVLTDRAMPLMGGDQMAAAVRRLDPTVPIILISGFGDIMKVTGELPEGVTLIIGKPVTMNTLRAAMAEALRQRKGNDGAA